MISFFVFFYFVSTYSGVLAQPTIPGIHGMSITQGVRFTSVNVTGDNQVSMNLRYDGTGLAPPVTIVATATDFNEKNSFEPPTTIGGNTSLNAGWNSSEVVTVKLNSSKSIYDSKLITIVASPSEQQSTSGIRQNSLGNTLKENLNRGTVKVLSMNSFIDSIGYLHVVGEIENNTPNLITYVKATATFYDINNQVVGTDYTYTNPTDLGSGDKAPFEIILTSASIPLSEIDHYRVAPSYQ